jgi:hypothetical protein
MKVLFPREIFHKVGHFKQVLVLHSFFLLPLVWMIFLFLFFFITNCKNKCALNQLLA